MITIYKPNAKNTGALASFTASSKDECIYVEMLKQKAWDAEKKTGTFDNEKKTSAKIGEFEIGGMIRAIEHGEKFHAYHSTKSSSKTVSLSPASWKNNKGEEVNFLSFQIGVGKDDKFNIGITYAEAEVIKMLCKDTLSAIIKKRAIEKAKNAKTEN